MSQVSFRRKPRFELDLILVPLLCALLGWVIYSLINFLLSDEASGFSGFWDILVSQEMLHLLGFVTFIEIFIYLWRRWWHQRKRERKG